MIVKAGQVPMVPSRREAALYWLINLKSKCASRAGPERFAKEILNLWRVVQPGLVTAVQRDLDQGNAGQARDRRALKVIT